MIESKRLNESEHQISCQPQGSETSSKDSVQAPSAAQVLRTNELIKEIRETLKHINAEDRLWVFSEITDGYCRYCGGDAPCCCWNDE